MEFQDKPNSIEKHNSTTTQDTFIYANVLEDLKDDDDKKEKVKTLNNNEKNLVIGINVETQCEDAEDSVDGKRKESNQFASKKATAEGMMDVALLTANANQLRFLMAYNTNSKTYVLIMILIILSLILQTVVGFTFICKRYWKCRNDKRKSRLASEFLVAIVFLITLINIFVATFSTTE